MKLLYRPVKGTLEETMKERKEYKDLYTLYLDLSQKSNGDFTVTDIGIYYQGYDSRIDWETFIIVAKAAQIPIGYCTIIEEN